MTQKGRGTSSLIKKQTCRMCGKRNYGDFTKGMINCFGCGKCGQKVPYFPNMKGQYNEYGQDSGSNDALMKNKFILSALGVSKRLPRCGHRYD